MRCVECGAPQASAPLVEVPGGAICHRCITELLGGAVPDRIATASGQAVYWWWCVCGKQVRRGPYTVDTREVARNWIGSDKQFMREVERIAGYRWGIEGVPSAGVMLCKGCAASAGVPLPAPAPPRYGQERGGKILDLETWRREVRTWQGRGHTGSRKA